MMVGDVVGKAGREAALSLIPGLRTAHKADFVILNAENSAGGLGITPDIARSLLDRAKVDVITLGNHAWAKKEVYTYLDDELRILRPANYPPRVPGRGYGVFQTPHGAILVGVLQGRTFMDPSDDPFRTADSILEEVGSAVKVRFLEIHGEATSEKQAFGWYVDGRASAVVGTHTHVQTADERILPGGTAYLSDVGMTGPYNSVIGMKVDVVLPRFLTHLPIKFEVADGPAVLCAALIDVDETTGSARSISRLQVQTDNSNRDQPSQKEE
jgi:metallophosphoesterase (TIGR00282 family)